MLMEDTTPLQTLLSTSRRNSGLKQKQSARTQAKFTHTHMPQNYIPHHAMLLLHPNTFFIISQKRIDSHCYHMGSRAETTSLIYTYIYIYSCTPLPPGLFFPSPTNLIFYRLTHNIHRILIPPNPS